MADHSCYRIRVYCVCNRMHKQRGYCYSYISFIVICMKINSLWHVTPWSLTDKHWYFIGSRFIPNFVTSVPKFENKETEQVKSFKYPGSTVNTDNWIEQEIKERTAVGNKAFFANIKIFQSKLTSKTAKLKLYFSVIRPVVTYACETWILKETTINRLMVFERKVLRKILAQPMKMDPGE